MNNNCEEYALQLQNAKDAVATLESDLYNIRIKLKNKPNDAYYLRELKQLTIDMTITLNEIEHSQSLLDACKRKLRTVSDTFND